MSDAIAALIEMLNTSDGVDSVLAQVAHCRTKVGNMAYVILVSAAATREVIAQNRDSVKPVRVSAKRIQASASGLTLRMCRVIFERAECVER